MKFLTVFGKQVILIFVMSFENFVNKSLVVVLSNIAINFAHNLAELSLIDPLIFVQIWLESLQDVILEIASDDRWLLEWVENCGYEVCNNFDVDGFCLSVLKSQNSENLKIVRKLNL